MSKNSRRTQQAAGRRKGFDFDTIVVGAGPAGSTAAEILASAGQKVALVEAAQKLGGECLNYGCIPTKSMLEVVHAEKRANTKLQAVGISRPTKLNLSRLVSYAQKAVKDSGADKLADLIERSGIQLLRGRGYLLGKNQIDVNGRSYSARNFILATGGEPVIPEIPGLDSTEFLTYKNFLSAVQKRLPKKVVIIGGGVVGCEYAQILQACGISVCIVERSNHLLAELEVEASNLIAKELTKCGIDLYLGAEVMVVSGGANISKEVKLRHNQASKTLKADTILVTVGKSFRDQIGLENLGLELEQGRLPVNGFCQSAVGNVYAIGDLAGPLNLTSTAIMQSKAATANILARSRKDLVATSGHEERVPHCVFTIPEVASIGISTSELAHLGVKLKVSLVNLKETAKFKVDSDSTGFVKLWFDAKSEVLLGGCIVSEQASEVISTLSLAIEQGLKIKDLAALGTVFPSISEGIRLAAEEVQ